MNNHQANHAGSSALLVIGLGVLLSCSVLSPAAGDAPSGEVDAIVKDWTQRRDALHSMRWVITGKVLVPKRTLRDRTLPLEDYSYDTRTTWVFDYQVSRCRKEVVQESFDERTGTFRPNHAIFLFDAGKQTTTRYFPGKGNPFAEEHGPQLGIVEHANRIDYTLSDYPVFLCQGNVIPLAAIKNLLGPLELRPPLSRERFVKGANQRSNGRDCLTVKLFASDQAESDVDELWVEPGPGHRILRADSFSKGQLLVRSEMEYEKDQPFPRGWTTTVYQQQAEPTPTPREPAQSVLQIERMNVQEAQANAAIDPQLFEIELQPGMLVRKMDVRAGFERNFAATNYRVAEDGKTLVEIRPSPAREAGPDWGTRVIPFLVLFAIFVCAILWRRMNRGRTQ